MKRRAFSFFLCVLVTSGAFWTGLFTLGRWDDLWSGGNYYQSASLWAPLNRYSSLLEEALSLTYTKQWEGDLLYTEQERLESITASLTPASTYFRYQVHDQSGRLIMDNLNGQLLERTATGVQQRRLIFSHGEELRREDYWRIDPETDIATAFMVYTRDGFVPTDPAEALDTFNRYGYHFYSDREDYSYDADYDQRVQQADLVMDFGVVPEIGPQIKDDFFYAEQEYYHVQQWLPAAGVAAGLLSLAALWLLSRLCRRAGRDRETGALTLSWQDRVPLELYLAADFFLYALLLSAGDTAAYNLNTYGNPASYVGVALFSSLGVAVALLLLETLSVRVKSRTLLHNTYCARLWNKLREAFSNWPMVSRAVILFLLYLLGTLITSLTLVLIPFFQGFVLWHICRYVKQWKAIQAGTARMVQGEPEFAIDTRKLYPDLREHAQQLNDLGAGMARAVEERIRGERFKAELITNVSHDLKTPLTSIINYVDLLKKAGISDQAALEYLEVLDRKSQRLKKLTEDLVEASKASTGSLTVVKDKLGFTQLLSQALGEYEEKLSQASLETVWAMPDHELYVEADGRHLWRVIDNLLGNCAKYAMPGTRVYIDVKAWDDQVCLSIKNISRNALNIPAQQLTERFVRGEESRTTEGSGLGLSIAQSLTELQGGKFRIDIDGDLFKAVVTFPEYHEPIPLPEGGTL